MANNYSFPIIETEGSPYDIGFMHGSKAKKQIENTIEIYKSMFAEYANLEWEDAKKRALVYKDYIENFDSELLEEIAGIAKGSGRELEELLILNARSEVIFQGTNITDGCTSLALTPEITLNNETIIGQNWDWKPSIMDSMIVLKIKQNNKPNILMITEAGIIGKIGLNSSGLGVCLNALGTDKKVEGVPLHIVLRGILNSHTLNDSIDVVAKAKISGSANYLIAHSEGEAVDIEVAAEDFDVIFAEDNFLVHTNHFTSLRLTHIKDTGKIILPDSFTRLGRTKNILKEIIKEKEISIRDVQSIFKNHMGYPDSICRHEDLKDKPDQRLATVMSLIMNLDRKEIFLSPGSPCFNTYNLYKL